MKFFHAYLSLTFVLIAFACVTEPEPMLPGDGCETLIANFEAALNAYTADPTNRTKCISVKEAGTLLVDCPALSPAQKTDYKNQIDAIYCN